RVITSADSCPSIEVDGRALAMSVRAEPDPPLFPVLTCELTLPAGARAAALGPRPLPLPPSGEPARVAVVGDTGCRLETGDPPQSCNDPVAWPFARVATAIADLAPDVILHVGDYLYRESPCPEGDGGCAGSPFGYDWETIDADFFAPAEPLFRAAPLALTRGNHESCSRAGAVWFRFLDPRPYDGACVDYTEPYAIELGSLQLLMFDSSAANDRSVAPAQLALYRPQFDQVARLAGPRALFATHRPMWVFGHAGEQDGMEVLFTGNPTLEAASENQLPAGVEIALSGHVHLQELLAFDAARSPQFVIGNGGTSLDPPIQTPLAGLEIGGAVVADAFVRDDFGFATLEPKDVGWRATMYDVAG